MLILKKTILLFFLISNTINAQNLRDVDKIVYSYAAIDSVEELAKRIDYDFKTDLEKARAAYTWLTLNIEYYKKYSNVLEAPKFYVFTDKEDQTRRLKRIKNQLIRKTINSKKAICKGYAYSFQKICDLLHIENKLIYGYVRSAVSEIGYIPTRKNHVWNTIKINNKWRFVDVTWGVNNKKNGVWHSKFNEKYFDISKEEINLTHFPSKQIWLDHLNQKPLDDFCLQPICTDVFLNSNSKIIAPKKGEIILKKNKKIQLKIKDIDIKTKVLYRFGASGIAKAPKKNYENSMVTFTFENPDKSSDLNIYFNGQLALRYKVEVH